MDMIRVNKPATCELDVKYEYVFSGLDSSI